MEENKLIKGTFWSFIGIFGRQGSVLIIGIILARLLEPAQFGMIAMITVFSNFGQLFLSFGFSSALIQNISTNQKDLSTVFFFNLGMGCIMGGLLFFGSYPLAQFYNQPSLVNIAKAISIIFIFNALSIVHRTILFKNLKLKIESIIIILSSAFSGLIAIYLAFTGFGVWALAYKIVVQSFLECILLIIYSGWKPSFLFSLISLKKFLNFSLRMFSAGILHNLTLDLDKLIIGKVFNAGQLGFFERAKHFNEMAQTNLGNALSKVMFPALSNIQNNSSQFNSTYQRTIRTVAFIVIPLFLGLSIIAKPLIVVLLTEKWLYSAKILQIIAITGFAYPLSTIMVNAIAAKGRADIFLILDIVKTTLYIICIIIGLMWGIYGVAYAIAIVSLISFYINIFAVSKLLKTSIFDHLKNILFPIINSSIMVLFLVCFSRVVPMEMIAKLIILPATGAIVYLVTSYFFNRRLLFEFKSVTIGLIRR